MTTLTSSTTDPTTAAADVLLIGVGKSGDGIALAGGATALDAALGGRLAETLTALGAKGSPGEITKLATFGAIAAPTVVAVGLGAAGDHDYTPEALRRATGAAVRSLAGTARVATTLAMANLDETAEVDVAAVAEGALLGAYRFAEYRSGGEDGKTPVEAFELLGVGADTDLRRAAVLAESVSIVRDLVNTAPRDLPPAVFAERARALASEAGLTVEVLDESALAEGGYGGIVGVGQGSSRPPRLVRLEHSPAGATSTVAIVGKGITFDSGGLSLKPAQSMETMKSDMAGAAAVLGTLLAAARLDLGLRVVGYLPMAENMPSGEAIRPSDILTMYGGKTVEVLNTDAEGRLVLADALVRSAEDSPDLVVDIATLTGAQVMALGLTHSAVMGTDEARSRVVTAGDEAGEGMWPMPLPVELRAGIDSDIADLQNIGDRNAGAGMLSAGMFLQQFAPQDVEWAHIDIAGPSFSGKAHGYTPKGGTGVGVRTMVTLLEDVAVNGI